MVLLGEIRHGCRTWLAFTRPYFGHGQQHVEHLRGLEVLRRVEQQGVDRQPARLEVALQLRALRADLVRPLKGVHPLVAASARAPPWLLCVVDGRPASGAASHTHRLRRRKLASARIRLDLHLRWSVLQPG